MVIGRAVDLDLSFADDKSISRKHIEMTISDQGLWVKDLNSRFGSTLNDQKLSPDIAIPLNQLHSVLKLGAMRTVIEIINYSFFFCTTRLEKGEKEKLKVITNNYSFEYV